MTKSTEPLDKDLLWIIRHTNSNKKRLIAFNYLIRSQILNKNIDDDLLVDQAISMSLLLKVDDWDWSYYYQHADEINVSDYSKLRKTLGTNRFKHVYQVLNEPLHWGDGPNWNKINRNYRHRKGVDRLIAKKANLIKLSHALEIKQMTDDIGVSATSRRLNFSRQYYYDHWKPLIAEALDFKVQLAEQHEENRKKKHVKRK